MRGQVSGRDIDVFLTNNEIQRLCSKPLEGILVRLKEPRAHFPLIVSVSKEEKIIGVQEENGKYHVSLSEERYEMLKGSGFTGMRYTPRDKVFLVEENRARGMDLFDLGIRFVDSYISRMKT